MGLSWEGGLSTANIRELMWCHNTPGDAEDPLGKGRRTSTPVAKLLEDTAPDSQHHAGNLLHPTGSAFHHFASRKFTVPTGVWVIRVVSGCRDVQMMPKTPARPQLPPKSHGSTQESCFTPSIKGRGRSPGTALPATTLLQTVKVY